MAITRIGNPAIADVREPNFRNIIINGDMSLAQRGTSETGLGNGDSGYHTCDRWRFSESGSPTYEFTMSQSTDAPSGQGFSNSLKYDCTTADTALAADDALRLEHRIEGQNLQYLKKGTSNAQKLTLSFWVKSNKTGTYTAEVFDNDNNRQNPKTYTIDTADTWEKKIITYDGDTTGALGNDNDNSFMVNFFLGAGSNWTSGTFSNGTWEALVKANRVHSSQVNLADSTSNEWYVTGVQLEAGSVASDFEFLPVDVNLQRCQRYCNALMDYGDGSVTGNRLFSAQYSSGGFTRMSIPRMRIQPTLTYVISGGVIDTDYGSPDLIQLYDGSDAVFFIYDVLAEAEL